MSIVCSVHERWTSSVKIGSVKLCSIVSQDGDDTCMTTLSSKQRQDICYFCCNYIVNNLIAEKLAKLHRIGLLNCSLTNCFGKLLASIVRSRGLYCCSALCKQLFSSSSCEIRIKTSQAASHIVDSLPADIADVCSTKKVTGQRRSQSSKQADRTGQGQTLPQGAACREHRTCLEFLFLPSQARPCNRPVNKTCSWLF